MSEKRIDIRSKEGFSIYLKFLAVVFIVVAFLIISDYPAIAAILSFICLLILTARSGLEIDRENKTYQQYMSFFFVIKMGKPIKYEAMEKIYIASEQVLKRTALGSSRKDLYYSANLKLKNGDLVKLMTEKDKNAVVQKAKVVSIKLNVPVKEDQNFED